MPSPTERPAPGFAGAVTAAEQRWRDEGEKHARSGDYAWMADRLPAGRVLEIGCGAGFGTQALLRRGASVLVLEPSAGCLAQTRARCGDAAPESGVAVEFLQATVAGLDDAARRTIESFAPQWVVCWLMGADEATSDPAPDPALNPSRPSPDSVRRHRETVHRQVAELTAGLPSARGLHLVDRTVFPWKIKDTARETLVLYHHATTLAGLPLTARIEDATYRKLDARHWPPPPGQRLPAGAVPVLGSLLVHKS